MAGFEDTVGLYFKIRADSDEARSELDKFSKDVKKHTDDISSAGENTFNRLSKSVGLSASQTATLSAALPVAGAAITGVAATVAGFAAATVGVGVALFTLAKNASELGSAIFDVSQKTGIGATTISALKLAADGAGSSLESISGGLGRFAKLMSDASNGSEKAKANLRALGVTSTDLETAFGQATKTIYNAKEGMEQMGLAQKALGRGGADLIPVINQMDGDLAAFTDTAEKAGKTLSDADVAAADAFGDSLQELTNQVSIVGAQFALQFAPEIKSSMDDISQYLTENKDNVRAWGDEVSNLLRGAKEGWRDYGSYAGSILSGIASITRTGADAALGKNITGIYDVASKGFDPAYAAVSTKGAAARAADPKSQYSPEFLRLINDKSRIKTSDNNDSGGDDSDWLDPKAKAKKAKKEVTDSFDKQFRALAKEYEMPFSRTFGKRVNATSLHPDGLAGDVGVKGKTNAESFAFIAAGIEKGWRAIDERVVGAFKGIKSTGPNIHMEKGKGVKPSLFLDESFYPKGGKAYLEKLDADRRNKKAHTDDLKKYQEDLTKQNEQENEKNVKSREEADNRILGSAKRTADQELALLDQLRVGKIVSEEDYAAKTAKIEADLLEREKKQIEARLLMSQLQGDARIKTETELAAVINNISVKAVEASTAAIERRNGAEGKRKTFALDVAKEAAATERDGNELFFRQEREKYLLELEHGRNRLVNLEGLATIEAEYAKTQLKSITDRLDEEEKAYLKEAALLQASEEVKKSIRDTYILKREQAEADSKERERLRKLDEDAAIKTEKLGGTAAGGVAGILSDVVGGGVDPENKIKNQADYMKAVHADLAASAKQAIGSMVQGLGQLAAQWLSTGKFSAKAALQMVSGIATALAIEAGLKALMEVAAGYASLAIFDARGAAMHFSAAAGYGIAAAAAGAVGVGTGLAARAFGGGAGGGGGSASGAFKSQTSSGAINTTQGRQGNGNGGGYYSGENSNNKNNVIEENRNSSPQIVEHRHVVVVESKDSHIIRVVEDNVNTRGNLHGLIIKTGQE